MKRVNKLLAILFLSVVIGFATNSFARMGQGPGMGGGMNGYSNLTSEQIEQLKIAKRAFFENTADLKQQIHSKRLELNLIMSKKDPNVKNAKSVLKELFSLKTKLEEKRLEHKLELKKIAPNIIHGPGFLGGQGGGGCGGCGGCMKGGKMNGMMGDRGY